MSTVMPDLFEPGHRHIIVATKSRSRYWDGDSVRGEPSEWELRYAVDGYGHHGNHAPNPDRADGGVSVGAKGYVPKGAPLLDYWIVGDDAEPEPKAGPMGNARFIVADVFDGLASLEPGSVDLIVSSPPFLALRSYLPADHELKHKEIGSEPTPGAFIDTLLDVVEACARVLAPHGSLVFELGDTYAGADRGGDAFVGIGDDNGHVKRPLGDMPKRDLSAGWPLDKCKVLVPQLFAVALAYGFNPLTGRKTEPWRVRNVVAWCRPNPPVGRDGDKFRPATSYLTVVTKARDRYWDGDAVRTEHSSGDHKLKYPNSRYLGSGKDSMTDRAGGGYEAAPLHPAGAPLLDYWELPTHPYPGAHYATYPPQLVVPLVKSMAPRRVCRVCGEPSRRIVESERCVTQPQRASQAARSDDPGFGQQGFSTYTTLGWSDCGHNNWRAGLVLDPFAGSGTTLEVASGHGLDCIGIDLDARNAELARERVGGLFLTIETLEAA